MMSMMSKTAQKMNNREYVPAFIGLLAEEEGTHEIVGWEDYGPLGIPKTAVIVRKVEDGVPVSTNH